MDSTLQSRVHLWRQKNFPGATPEDQLFGVVEEVGELVHANLKRRQNIRGDELTHRLAEQDAVGDIVIYLMGYCSTRGFHLEQIVEETAREVMKRDWIKYPTDGLLS